MLSLQDAKNRFSAVVGAALAGRPQRVSRRGKPAVVVVAAAESDRLLIAAGPNRGSFAEHLMDFPGEDVPRAALVPRDVTF